MVVKPKVEILDVNFEHNYNLLHELGGFSLSTLFSVFGLIVFSNILSKSHNAILKNSLTYSRNIIIFLVIISKLFLFIVSLILALILNYYVKFFYRFFLSLSIISLIIVYFLIETIALINNFSSVMNTSDLFNHFDPNSKTELLLDKEVPNSNSNIVVNDSNKKLIEPKEMPNFQKPNVINPSKDDSFSCKHRVKNTLLSIPKKKESCNIEVIIPQEKNEPERKDIGKTCIQNFNFLMNNKTQSTFDIIDESLLRESKSNNLSKLNYNECKTTQVNEKFSLKEIEFVDETESGGEYNYVLKKEKRNKKRSNFPTKFLFKFLCNELLNKDVYGIFALYLAFEESLIEIILGIIFGFIGLFIMIFSTNFFYTLKIIYWKILAFGFSVMMFILIYTD